MILNISNHDFSIQWEGVYYKALSNYPNLTEWELQSILDFIAYEEKHKRKVSFEVEDQALLEKILAGIKEKNRVKRAKLPDIITECTACNQKGCLTEFICHVAPPENALKILESGYLLSAKCARRESIEILMAESRNAAGDPADFFDYIMFSWGNCQAGDRLVMERKYKRPPSEEDLSHLFTPGIRFYFKYSILKEHEGVCFDGYHALKIKDRLDIEPYLHCIVIPEGYKDDFSEKISPSLKDKVFYMKQDCKDIWDWSEKVYKGISGVF